MGPDFLRGRCFYPVPRPLAGADRPAWGEVPPVIRQQIESIVGGRIVSAETAHGGYGPSAAFFLTTESNRQYFAKGSHPRQEAHGYKMIHQEMEAYARSPVLAGLSPSLLGYACEGGEDDWHLAVFDCIADACPLLPWDDRKFRGVFEHIKTLHLAGPEMPPMKDVSLMGDFASGHNGWKRVADEAGVRESFCSLFPDRKAIDVWLDRALPDLQALSFLAPDIGGPQGILHGDLRSDNILLDAGGRFYLIDAPNACYGPVIFDLAFFLAGASAESGRPAGELLSEYQRVTGLVFHVDDVKKALASVSAYYAVNAGRKVPVRLPQLRWVQRQHLWGLLCWISDLFDFQIPPEMNKN